MNLKMTFFQRILTYCQEQLEPFSRLFLSIVVNLFIYLLMKQDHEIETFSWQFLIPAFSTFFLLIYYRISDEFKDVKTDEKFFPDRPIPSGRLFLSDLKVMLIAVSIMGLTMNLFYRDAIIEYMMAFLFTVAMGKWFFLEKQISSNRLLAFFTHAPVGFFLYWYSEIYLINVMNVSWSLPEKLTVIAFIVLPGFSWEILRKTYLPQDEMPGYQIYSTMLGFRGSLAFGALWVLVTLLNNFHLVSMFTPLQGLALPLSILNFLLLGAIIAHALKPKLKNLKPVVEVYMALHLLIPMGLLIYQEWWV